MLIVVAGPMFAGKTTWLLDYTKKLPKDSFQVFKPSIDTRYAEAAVVSHNGGKIGAQNLDIHKPLFPTLVDTVKTILIDELNFFKHPTLLPVVKEQLALGRDVIGVGLMYDFLKNPFGATPHLAKIADSFVQLFATCDNCGKKAKHSYRKIQQKAQVVIGAAESYGPCCTACWELLQCL